jgi:hypothetical protein
MIAAFLANPAALYSLAATALVSLGMVFIFATNYGGAFGRPHWPARFPHRPRPRHSDRWALLRRAQGDRP